MRAELSPATRQSISLTSTNPNPSMPPSTAAIRDIGILRNVKRHLPTEIARGYAKPPPSLRPLQLDNCPSHKITSCWSSTAAVHRALVFCNMRNGDPPAKSPEIIQRLCHRIQTDHLSPKTTSRRPSTATAPTAGCWYFAKCEIVTSAESLEIIWRRCRWDWPKSTAIVAAEMDNIGHRCQNHIRRHHDNPRCRPAVCHRFIQFIALQQIYVKAITNFISIDSYVHASW